MLIGLALVGGSGPKEIVERVMLSQPQIMLGLLWQFITTHFILNSLFKKF